MRMGSGIGILTFHRCINYGSYWQARCLVEGLSETGAKVELLDHDCLEVRRAEMRCALQPTLPEPSSGKHRIAYKAKTRRFEQAFEDFPQSRRFSLHDGSALPRYDAVVVGSDEVWNLAHPWYGHKPLFYGEGLKADRLLSYAASFGNYDAERGLDDYWRDKLARFSAISVRDNNSRMLVAEALGQEPPLVLDPCLQFADHIPREPSTVEKGYALVYGHGFPDWLGPVAREWAVSRGVRLISVGYACDFADEERIDVGPLDFPGFVAGAEAVITNFFHGCVFALAFGKPFAATVTPYRLNKVRDLTAKLGADKHLLRGPTDLENFAELLDRPPAPQVERRIEELRGTSQAYLDAALA
ncbi:polysaccharide pyruvyl transferase family protein [Sphingomonas swuensis]|uniref:Polysaccharide pyruvyl transferase family protein n=2 Tax=Sphingomonas swuensis TaxID=977800 RepID=A0ABP7SX73_9SPHN